MRSRAPSLVPKEKPPATGEATASQACRAAAGNAIDGGHPRLLGRGSCCLIFSRVLHTGPYDLLLALPGFSLALVVFFFIPIFLPFGMGMFMCQHCFTAVSQLSLPCFTSPSQLTLVFCSTVGQLWQATITEYFNTARREGFEGFLHKEMIKV